MELFPELFPHTQVTTINNKSHSDWSDQLFFQGFWKPAPKDAPRLGRCWWQGPPHPRRDGPGDQHTLRASLPCPAASSHLQRPGGFCLSWEIIKFCVWRALLALQSNLQWRPELLSTRRASKGGIKRPSVLVWTDFGSSASDQEGENTLWHGKQVNWNLPNIIPAGRGTAPLTFITNLSAFSFFCPEKPILAGQAVFWPWSGTFLLPRWLL